jgi:LacI family transcriptional regulator
MVVTLKNIANKAGVDISVVSRVLNNKGDEFRISKERQDTVRKMAKSLGYVPNVSAPNSQTRACHAHRVCTVAKMP